MTVATPTTRAQSLIAVEERYGSHNYHPLDVVCERGEGVYLWDVEGKRYMDFLASYSAVNQGHNHPRIAEALVAQARKLALTSRAFRNDRLPGFLEKLCTLTGFDKALPMNSGAEAVETSIKASRKWGYDVKGIPYPEAEIVVAEGNFHGRTTTIVGFSTDPDSTSRFGPFTPGFRIVEYGSVAAVEAAITPETAAIFVEPIQGEGGVVIPPDGYLRGLRELADKHSCLLILDEIQSGLGRTGKLFAFEHEGIRPDGVTIGKALSGGFYPVSAFLSSNAVMDVFTPGIHGSTYGGNPLACAVGIASLDVDARIWTHYTTAQGLVSNLASAVAVNRAGSPWPEGTLWVATQNGVTKRAPDGTLVNYAEGSGLPNLRSRKVVVDKNNNVWLAFVESGAARVKP